VGRASYKGGTVRAFRFVEGPTRREAFGSAYG
jgi:hypothetical protein